MSVQVLMILAAVWPAAADPTKPTKWEYRILRGQELYELGKAKEAKPWEKLTANERLKGVEPGLNKLGDEGWELVSPLPSSGGFGNEGGKYFFKRPSLKAAPPPDKTPPEDKGKVEVRVFSLQNAKAAEAARVLQELFGKGTAIKIVADERTNCVLTSATEEGCTKVVELLRILDGPARNPKPDR